MSGAGGGTINVRDGIKKNGRMDKYLIKYTCGQSKTDRHTDIETEQQHIEV